MWVAVWCAACSHHSGAWRHVRDAGALAEGERSAGAARDLRPGVLAGGTRGTLLGHAPPTRYQPPLPRLLIGTGAHILPPVLHASGRARAPGWPPLHTRPVARDRAVGRGLHGLSPVRAHGRLLVRPAVRPLPLRRTLGLQADGQGQDGFVPSVATARLSLSYQ